MTGSRPEGGSAAADTAQTFLDWTRVNGRALIVGAVALALAASAYWFYGKLRQNQAISAGRALGNARQSLQAGNLPLAQSDLQKVVDGYGSTPAGVEAALLLAQVDYDQHKPLDGINVLKQASRTGAGSTMQATILGLTGDGYSQLGKLLDAAKEYDAAAAASELENERLTLRGKAARAYATAGDTATAQRIWSGILVDPKAQAVSAEARVRLGELTARVAKR